MPAYKQIGTPAHVAGDSNASDNSVVVKNRLLGIPNTTPQSSFTLAVIAALRAISTAGGFMIDTVNRKVSVSDDEGAIDAFLAAADGGANVATLTPDDLVSATPMWAIDDVAELNAILGGELGTLLELGTFATGKSLESCLNALINKAGAEGKSVVVAGKQETGVVKIASYASDGAQTTACNTAREETAGPSIFETVSIPAPEVEESTGPVWGL